MKTSENYFWVILIGVTVGIVFSLSESSVTSIVIGSILSLSTGVILTLSGVRRENDDTDKKNTDLGLIGAFSLSIVIMSCVGLFVRAQTTLLFRNVDNEIREWTEVIKRNQNDTIASNVTQQLFDFYYRSKTSKDGADSPLSTMYKSQHITTSNKNEVEDLCDICIICMNFSENDSVKFVDELKSDRIPKNINIAFNKCNSNYKTFHELLKALCEK
jgi:hypothetical protein